MRWSEEKTRKKMVAFDVLVWTNVVVSVAVAVVVVVVAVVVHFETVAQFAPGD